MPQLMHIPELHRFIMYAIEDISPDNTILDLGCGFGFWEGFLRSILPEQDLYILGVDLYKDQLLFCKNKRRYDDVVLADARFLPFKESSVDAVIATELIEHLERTDGINLLGNLDKLARKKIVISTPNGYIEIDRNQDGWLHKSGWKVSDFRSRGFRVIGVGFGPYKVHEAKARVNLRFALFYFFTPLSFKIPRWSESLIAWKNVKKEHSKNGC